VGVAIGNWELRSREIDLIVSEEGLRDSMGVTHSFLFFGPGFPLGFTTPSTSKLALFFPFPPFTPPSVGGGIATESSVPLGTGVFPFDASPSASGDAVGALESESDEVDEDAGFSSASLLMASVAVVAGRNLERWVEESLRRTMRDLVVVEDFLVRLPPLGVEGEALCALAMVRVCVSRLVVGGKPGMREVLCTCV
jgi:hypothetical protein